MKTFISAEDIEALAEQGIRELTVDDDTLLTAVARETAAQRGIRLVAPGAAGATGRLTTTVVAQANVPGKPKGCQHGPLGAMGVGANGRSPAQAGAPTSATGGRAVDGRVVDDLIGAVKQMARK